MRSFSLLLLGFFALVSPAQAQPVGPAPIYCNLVGETASLAAGTTQVVAGVAGKIISICGFNYEGLANGTVQLVYGTGSTCTSSTPITGNFTTLVNGSVVDHIATAFISGLQGQFVCAIVTGTGSIVIATVYYSIN